MRKRLDELAMKGASFEIELTDRDPGPSGGDGVEFLIAPNPGVPAGPLRETASGGELSRIMLALMGVAAGASRATLVFDEVDAGIGGQTARAVGDQLRALAAGPAGALHHAPAADRIAGDAALLDREGRVGQSRRARPSPSSHADDVVSELVRMLGADDDGDVAARRHAEELLRAAA